MSDSGSSETRQTCAERGDEHAPGRAIAIVGMHRSGTSVVAGVIHKLGVAIGRELIPSTSFNPLGHFEDIDFMRLNTAILRRAGGDWDSPPPRDALLSAAFEYRDAIHALVRTRTQSADIWGWKEPRTTLLLPAYQAVIPRLRVVNCVRASREVERSLCRRNGFDPGFSRSLKRHYDREIAWFQKNYPDVPLLTVDFQNLRNDPERVTDAIADFVCPGSLEQSIKNEACAMVLAPSELEKYSSRHNDAAYLVRAAFRRPWRIAPVLYWRMKRAYWRRRWYWNV